MIWKTFILHIPDWNQRINILQSQIRPLLSELEKGRLIAGYNYNFYGPANAHIALRVESMDDDSLDSLRVKIEGLGMKVTEQNYIEPEHVKNAYELGSRWAFLLWGLVGEGRIPAEQIKDVNFRLLALHGLFNSMGFGYDDEALSYCFGLSLLADQGKIGNPKIKKVAETLLKACKDNGLLQRRV